MSNLFVNAVTYPFCASPGSHSLKWTEGPELPQEVTVELLISTNRKLLYFSSAYLWWAVLTVLVKNPQEQHLPSQQITYIW